MNVKELDKLTKYIRSGIVTSKDIISIIEKDVKSGKTEPEVLTHFVKYLALIEKLGSMGKNEYIDIQELVNLGFYNSVDEIKDIINENPNEFKNCAFTVRPCTYPEPTTDEINQDIEYDSLERICIICCCRLKNTVFIPCGHTLCCTVCSKTIAEKAKDKDESVECLVCKKNVTDINKLYL